jgi:hypothetical protein
MVSPTTLHLKHLCHPRILICCHDNYLRPRSRANPEPDNPTRPTHSAHQLGPAPLPKLFNIVNTFSKENGFGIVRRNVYSYKGRLNRYSFPSDRFGLPQPQKAPVLETEILESGDVIGIYLLNLQRKANGFFAIDPSHCQRNHERSLAPSGNFPSTPCNPS